MIDDFRDLARSGLAPLVEEVPEGPDWDDLIATPAAPGTRSAPGWLIGVAAALVVFGVVGITLLLQPTEPAPPVDSPVTTTSFDDVVEPFDAEQAAADTERWWDLVIGGDFEGAAESSHPESQFNFPGLIDFIGHGDAIDVEAFSAAFGTDIQPQVCFVVTGRVEPRTGSMVYRWFNGEWLPWEVRPNVERCLDGEVEFPVDITSFDLIQPIPITVFASDANGHINSWIDLEGGTISSRATQEQIDGYSSAIVEGETRVYSWALDGSIYENGVLVLEPAEPAFSMRVLGSPVRDAIWVVYAGGPNAVADLYTLSDDQRIVRVTVEDNARPVAVVETALIVNTEHHVDSRDGLIVEPGSERVGLLNTVGEVLDLGPGVGIAANSELVAILDCPNQRDDDGNCYMAAGALSPRNGLWVSDLSGIRELIEAPFFGTWFPVGGPIIPSDSMPLPTVSPDGTRLLMRLGQNLDVNGVPATSQLMVVDLETGETAVLAEYGRRTHEATWSRDGEWVVTFDYRDDHRIDVTVIEVANPSNTFTYTDLIPDGQFPMAAG